MSKTFIIVLAAIFAACAAFLFVSWYNGPHYRSAAAACISRLRNIDSAKEQWVLEQHKTTNDVPNWVDLSPYFSSTFTNMWFTNGMPVCPSGGIYTIGRVGVPPTCSLASKWPGQHTMP